MHEGAAEPKARRSERRGAAVSSKQIAKAALHGRKVTMKFLRSQPAHEVNGYVVGMDDFHWLVASVIPAYLRVGDETVSLSLIHKSSADVIGLASDSTLNLEDTDTQKALTRLGGAFWSWCEENYSGRNGALPTT